MQSTTTGSVCLGPVNFETARIAGRIKGLFENSNDLALHLVTMIPIAVVLGLGGRNPLKKLIYFGAAGLMVAAVVVTFLTRRLYRFSCCRGHARAPIGS
jgi:predicted exporter